jgi:nitroreductase
METWEQYREGAFKFLSDLPMDVWVTRHTMIAVTIMMLVAETYGFDTAPMEGFDSTGVGAESDIPEEAEVVALLAIGRAQEPDKAYPGRFSLERIAFSERYGDAWQGRNREGRP